MSAPGTDKVVVNARGHHSIWFADRPNPPGWFDEGTFGNEDECAARIDDVWRGLGPTLRDEPPAGARA
ncbi:MbtH family protein [Rathayibacter tritici]|uniref:Antibiotic synthesis protein MbtH n=2 Tax=Rathayibacter tritici TaxID=33888 RepID=A0A160KVV3_9MICO|nr:antibiotic synthesis protein MbtH [Rathayibacter tritici]PPF30567.1 MbtH family protein [Rathayibacter tritici]PPF66678.1 MbtH family protein [Rathayibacter tritici]PPG09063.1 MbtH family protein [Rathayibacter tritici]PPI17865.1 MbtH family protein [Rathayibacter tritici]